MVEKGSNAAVLATREDRIERARALIRAMEADHDLQGLAEVAGISLSSLRYLCELPSACEQLAAIERRLREIRPRIEMLD